MHGGPHLDWLGCRKRPIAPSWVLLGGTAPEVAAESASGMNSAHLEAAAQVGLVEDGRMTSDRTRVNQAHYDLAS